MSGIHQVQQVMRNAVALFLRGLGRADIESAIDLRGIASQDLAAKSLRQRDAQRGFAGSRGSYDGNQGNWNGADTRLLPILFRQAFERRLWSQHSSSSTCRESPEKIPVPDQQINQKKRPQQKDSRHL